MGVLANFQECMVATCVIDCFSVGFQLTLYFSQLTLYLPNATDLFTLRH